jgi:glucosamine kinase
VTASAAIDGGQTALRLRVYHPGRTDTAAAGGGFTYAGEPAATVVALVEQAWSRLPPEARRPVTRVGVGLTGDYHPDEVDRIGAATAELCGAAEVRIAHDSVTAHLGALDGRPGVVVAAGTGVVALALTAAYQAHRVDGWGHLLGDGGGGFSVGQAGLRAALAAHDGRTPGTLLTALACDAFGPLDDLPRRLYGHADLVARIAGFSHQVATAARAGDPAANAIWREAVAALTTATAAAVSRYLSTGPQGPVEVSWTGGLFQLDDLVGEPWRRRVAERVPDAVLVPPAGDGLDGAHILAERPDDQGGGSPLWSVVKRTA